MSDDQDRNLPASERKIKRAREDGQVPRSRDMGHLMAMAVGGGLLMAMAQPLVGALVQVMAGGLRFNLLHLKQPMSMLTRLSDATLWLLAITVPMGLVMALVGVGAALLAGGWNFTLKPLMPAFSKLNPMSGLKRMVSPAHLGDMVKSCLLALTLGVIAALWLHAHWNRFQSVGAMSMAGAVSTLASLFLQGLGLLVLALALFALIDLPLQRLMVARRLRMSREEVKKEYKEMEGNAEVKGRMKARMREMASRRMFAAVPTADLVVMNPTHYAVAIKYDEATMGAPRVVAKGVDLVAMRIRDLAKDAKVPVLSMPPLARALHANVEVDGEVPAALFAAVAQVLVYVYQLRAAMSGQGPMPEALREVVVPAELDPDAPPPPPPPPKPRNAWETYMGTTE